MLNVKQESLITLSAACRGPIRKILGRQIAPPTACRWVRRGIRAGDGTRVVLRAVKVGREYMLIPSAIDDFFVALAQHTGDDSNASEPLDDAATNAKLKAFGLKSA